MGHGDACRPSCDDGYTLSGDTECAFGETKPSTCDPNACTIDQIIPNGTLGDCNYKLEHGDACTVECNRGYTHDGATSCTAGKLTLANCTPNSCEITAPVNGTIGACPVSLEHGKSCVPACADGYEIDGQTTCYLGESTSAICTPLVSSPENETFLTRSRNRQLVYGESREPTCDTGGAITPFTRPLSHAPFHTPISHPPFHTPPFTRPFTAMRCYRLVD
jgi:hypothetical protein